jgi:hypothetical protein
MKPVRHLLLTTALAALVLAGCATPGTQATVQSFSQLQTLPPNPSYRFERLPSQVGQPMQDQLEAAADAPLFRAGLRRDDASPKYAVQVRAGIDALAGPSPGWGSSLGIGIGGGGRGGGVGIGLGFPIGGSAPRQMQRVDVLVRELASGRTVYESNATGDGSVPTTALVDAALQGFPNPPPGPRTVPLAPAQPR